MRQPTALLFAVLAALPLSAQNVPPTLLARPYRGCQLVGTGGDSLHAGQPWPGSNVPYAYGPGVTVVQQQLMRAAMVELENAANVRFVPRTSEADYLVILDGPVNASAVGRTGGPQALRIFNWNIRFLMVHELMHVVGFWHEHQRPDRDQFVTIQWANVDPNRSLEFELVPTGSLGGTAYDFDSVMHFGATEASINSQPTIVVLPPNQSWQGQIGQRTHLSSGDRAGLRLALGSPVPPTITAIAPTSMRSALPQPVVVDGLLMDEVTRAWFGAAPVQFTRPSPTQIRFTPPPFSNLGNHAVTVESATGRSNALPLLMLPTDPPVLEVQPFLLRTGFANSIRVITDNVRFNQVVASFDNQPSVLPGIISLGLGSQFTTLGLVVPPTVGDARGLVITGLPVPPSVPPGVFIWFQSMVWDPAALTVPITVSNVDRATTF